MEQTPTESLLSASGSRWFRFFYAPGPALRSPTPAILFFDEDPWDSFVQLAAKLRQRGVVTIRVTTSRPRRASRLLGLVFSHTVCEASPDEVAIKLDQLLDGCVVIDIQTTETVAADAYRYASTLHAPHHTFRWAARPAMIDKVVMSATLAQAGIRVPATLAADQTTPAEAVATLGLPIVVKDRIGNGGRGVTIVRTLAELRACLDGSTSSELFYEQFIAGKAYSFACLATEAGIATAAVYRVADPLTPLGIPATLA